MALRASPAQIVRLATYSTCEISDALLKLGSSNGGFLPDFNSYSHGPATSIAGEAYTVQMVDSRDTTAPKLTQGHFVDLAPEGSIIVISSPPHVKSASFGGLLGLAAHMRGVKGVVIDGRCRDLAELNGVNLPVFARGHSTLGQSPFTRPSTINKPLIIVPLPSPLPSPYSTPFPPTTVNAYDLILADKDGIVVVAPSQLDQVLETAEEGRAVDELCRLDLLEGKGLKETFEKRRGKK